MNLIWPAVLVLVVILISFLVSRHNQMVEATLAAAEEYVAEREATVKQIPLLSVHEKQQLRTNPNHDHVTRARLLGVNQMANRDVAATAISNPNGVLREVKTNHRLIMDPRMSYGVPYLTHDAHNILQLIAERFQQQLRERDLPPHRILVTSVLRTSADQAALRGVNINAARGASSHEFGTTADIHYNRFDYIPEIESLEVPSGVYADLYKRTVQELTEDFNEVYQSQLKALLGRVMRELHEEGKLMVTMEQRQPVYHFTIDSPLSDEQLAEILDTHAQPIAGSAG